MVIKSIQSVMINNQSCSVTITNISQILLSPHCSTVSRASASVPEDTGSNLSQVMPLTVKQGVVASWLDVQHSGEVD